MRGVPATFKFVGSGISVPRVMYLQDEAGKLHKQLIKGNDDVRQDMLVQQIFALLNDFLLKAKLSIRTYKVVPCSPRAGVTEWVLNTMTFGDWAVK